MRKRILLFAVLAFAVLVLLGALLCSLWWKQKQAMQTGSEVPVAAAPVHSGPASARPPSPPPTQAAVPAAPGPNAQTVPAISSGTKDPPPPPQQTSDINIELDAVQLAFRDFRTAMGANPIGTNAEITKSMLGDNLKQVKIPVPQGSQLNGKGELCDRWGTPYFFHQVSHDVMEVRSAGADRVMWTDDDVELK